MLFGIFGCASVKEMNVNINSLTGMKIDRAITILGIGDPTSFLELENRRVYVWQSSSNMNMPMGGYNYGTDQFGNSVSTWDPNQSSSQIPLNCKITINTTKDYIIVNSFVEGDSIQCNTYDQKLKNTAAFLQARFQYLEEEETSLELLHTKDDVEYLGASKFPFTGIAASYYNNGQVKARINYKDGYKEGASETYFQNGQLKTKRNFKNGKPDGKSSSYFQNGQLNLSLNHKNGERIGLWEVYFDNGQLKQAFELKDGKKDGPSPIFDEEGKREKFLCYQNGEVVEKSYCVEWIQNRLSDN